MMDVDTLLSAIDRIRDIVSSHGKSPSLIGYDFELTFIEMCEDRGIVAEKPATRQQYDVIANGLRCQLKCREPTTKGYVTVQPCTRPAYDRSDFDVLVLRMAGGIYITPVDDIPRQNDGRLCSNIRREFFKKYADAWWIFGHGRRSGTLEVQLKLNMHSTEEGESLGR